MFLGSVGGFEGRGSVVGYGGLVEEGELGWADMVGGGLVGEGNSVVKVVVGTRCCGFCLIARCHRNMYERRRRFLHGEGCAVVA